MTTLLRRAAERYMKSPCRGVFARDENGSKVSPESPDARSWCAIGAVRAELPGEHQRMAAANCLDAAARAYGFDFVTGVNDHAPDLMPDILSEAIEADEAEPLTGDALLDAQAYEARRRAMIARGEHKSQTEERHWRQIMNQKLNIQNTTDESGNPTGGTVQGVGLAISWQDGPLGRGPERKEPNGAFVECVIAAAISRLEFYQSSKYRCEENGHALTHLENALLWLNKRTSDREARAVEGTHAE